jgi:hypothetical protein
MCKNNNVWNQNQQKKCNSEVLIDPIKLVPPRHHISLFTFVYTHSILKYLSRLTFYINFDHFLLKKLKL